ncbi:MAG: ribose-phosphate pyrophosphokinase [Oscillospiraceae bacterium]|nr:ribose-phosphate pyrophosphokinase [Oscillospiraceae bacterium]
MNEEKVRIFTANSNRKLACSIANALGLPLCNSEVKRFSDGEISVSINETVRGLDVFVIQSTCYPVNEHLMELLIMIDAFKRASAKRITAVIPYFGYARQDRKAKSRDPITAKLVADLITTAGADRVLTMDLHATQLQGFFNIPVDHLLGNPIFVDYYKDKFAGQENEFAIVAPDFGSVKRARSFMAKFNSPDAPISIVDKRRPSANESVVMNIIGDVKDKNVIIIDDTIDTAGTFCNAAEALIERGGAKKVYACATHGVLSGGAVERIDKSRIEEMVLLDTIPEYAHNQVVSTPKIKYLSVAPLFKEAIHRIYDNIAISPMFA